MKRLTKEEWEDPKGILAEFTDEDGACHRRHLSHQQNLKEDHYEYEAATIDALFVDLAKALDLGGLLSNAVYNLCQEAGEHPDPKAFELTKTWDSATRAIRKQI